MKIAIVSIEMARNSCASAIKGGLVIIISQAFLAKVRHFHASTNTGVFNSCIRIDMDTFNFTDTHAYTFAHIPAQVTRHMLASSSPRLQPILQQLNLSLYSLEISLSFQISTNATKTLLSALQMQFAPTYRDPTNANADRGSNPISQAAVA